MTTLSEDSQRLLDTLWEAGREAVERKCRLGQYAVVWRDGRPAFIGPNPPKSGQDDPAPAADYQRVAGVRKQAHDEPTD